MYAKIEILKVQPRKHLDKKTLKEVDVVDVAFATTNPLQTWTSTLYNQAVLNKEHQQFIDNTGKTVLCSVKPESWNGNVKLSLNSRDPIIQIKA